MSNSKNPFRLRLMGFTSKWPPPAYTTDSSRPLDDFISGKNPFLDPPLARHDSQPELNAIEGDVSRTPFLKGAQHTFPAQSVEHSTSLHHPLLSDVTHERGCLGGLTYAPLDARVAQVAPYLSRPISFAGASLTNPCRHGSPERVNVSNAVNGEEAEVRQTLCAQPIGSFTPLERPTNWPFPQSPDDIQQADCGSSVALLPSGVGVHVIMPLSRPLPIAVNLSSFYSLGADSESSLNMGLQTDKELPSLSLDLQLVLNQAATFVHTVTGTSQYAIGSPSACALASMNAVRMILKEERDGTQGCELLRIITGRRSFEGIMKIAPYWKDEGHLDVSDVHSLPLFESSLELKGVAHNLPARSGFEGFVRFLSDEAAKTTSSVAAVITKPPETVALFILKTEILEMPNLHVVFDSHSRRPLHSQGAAFVFLPSLETTVAYLTHLFHVDEGLNNVEDDWQWDAHRVFDGYIFLAKDGPFMDAVYQANVGLLSKDASKENALSRLRTENRTAVDRIIHELSDGHQHALNRRDSEHAAELVNLVQSHSRAMEEHAANDALARTMSESQWMARIRALNEKLYLIRSHIQMISGDGLYPPGESSSSEGEIRRQQQLELQNVRDLEEARTISGAVDSVPGGYHLSQPLPSAHVIPQTSIDDRDYMLALKLAREENNLKLEREWLMQEENASVASHRTALEDGIFAQQVADEDERIRQEFADENKRILAERDLLEQDQLFAQWLMYMEQVAQDDTAHEHRKLADDHKISIFDCAVCLEPHSEEDVAIVDSCEHKLCRDAMRSYILSTLEENRFPIMCPVCAIGIKDAGVISASVAEIVGLPPDKFQKWTELELAAHRIMIVCRQCKRTMQVDREQYTESTLIPCPMCAYVWCKHCGQEVYDEEHTCDGEAEMRRAMKQHGYKECPGCHTIVEKTSGCNHIACRAAGCNMHFCYIDGQPIVRSVRREEINAALEVHYNKCRLFDESEIPEDR